MQAGGRLAAAEGAVRGRGKDDTDALRLAFISLIGWHLPCRRRRRSFVLDCDWSLATSATPTSTPSPTPTRSRE